MSGLKTLLTAARLYLFLPNILVRCEVCEVSITLAYEWQVWDLFDFCIFLKLKMDTLYYVYERSFRGPGACVDGQKILLRRQRELCKASTRFLHLGDDLLNG